MGLMLFKKVKNILENKKIVDTVVLLFIFGMIFFIFYLTRKMNTIHFYAYTRFFYIPIIISALRYDLKFSLVVSTIVSVGEFMDIYLNDKSDILMVTFAISIPMYYFASISISFLKIQTEKLRKSIEEIKQNFMDMEDALISALEAKDVYTQGHSERVHKLVSQIVSKMKLKDEEVEDIIAAARLHDIGKIGIDDAVLNKPGRLTEDEYAQIMDHPVIGSEIVKKIKSMNNTSIIIRYHHEKYDGSGYPDGLKGKDIPLGSRIIAVADTFDAMTSKRSYRDPFSISEAVQELKKNTNIQFDPDVVNAFISVLSDIGIDY